MPKFRLRVGDIVRVRWLPNKLFQITYVLGATYGVAAEYGKPDPGWFCLNASEDLFEVVGHEACALRGPADFRSDKLLDRQWSWKARQIRWGNYQRKSIDP